jgi:hypothetical protein
MRSGEGPAQIGQPYLSTPPQNLENPCASSCFHKSRELTNLCYDPNNLEVVTCIKLIARQGEDSVVLGSFKLKSGIEWFYMENWA